MEKTDYLMLVQDICGLKLSGSVGGGYSYDKMELWSVLNGLHCYDIMSDISNKEKSYGTVWSRVDQDELLHSVENMTGYSTYAYSKKSYDECMRTASESIEVMNKKGILDYSDKRHIDRIISQIAFGLSIKLEKEWHVSDMWSGEPWFHKVPFIQDDHTVGDNVYFAREKG